MASYTGDVYRYLNQNLVTDPGGNPVAFDTNKIVEDDGGDTVFTVGEAVDDTTDFVFFPGGGTFVGTITVGTLELPLFSELDTGASLSDSEIYVWLPTGFDPSQLSPDLTTATAANLTECFLTGTRITTPDGETAVEDLAIGDLVLTADGTTVPVRWIGWQKVVCAFQPPERLMPVRVSAGALGDGLPKRDLTLTTDHALCVDGLLVNAGALVNGTTISQVPLSEFEGSYTVYHVETEKHDLILAEGTPAETYIDYLGRSNFHNYAEYLELYGEEVAISEMVLPRVSASRLVPDALRRKLSTNKAA